jgi:pimeloyl-ACP methyl ester carboxylesterase/predicted glycosyltransferase
VRAREPDSEGYVTREGVRLFYEVYGEGEQTVFFLPTWSIVHSRHWKAQIPYFARHFRVITFDGRGNGKSDRPSEPSAYTPEQFAADCLAVMDATSTERAHLVALSIASVWALLLMATRPERIASTVFIGPALALAPNHPRGNSFEERYENEEGWQKMNRHYWRKDYRGFAEFFFGQAFVEPHSTKQIEDCVGWALETTPEILLATIDGGAQSTAASEAQLRELLPRVTCPVLVIHGGQDLIQSPARGAALAEATGGKLVILEGSGHLPHARDPVKVNLLVRDFLQPTRSRANVWGRGRRKRALFISSPIGLGHARRDVAIAKELRKLVPDLEIDWLAQNPVTRVLEAEGERIHPASRLLASESAHIESESAEHDLHCFHAWRRMDEILIANFMLFHDVVRDDAFDLWIGDEAWELDHYLHENPEEKRAPYVWLTDFVGWLPMPEGGDREAFLAADYNAEMIGHIARFPRVRDRAIFVGAPEDIVPDPFGPDLPLIREWTEANYDFTGGYISGFDPRELADREMLRAELGYRKGEKVCVVSVGGSGVGAHLLRRVIAAFPEAKRRIPELRMIIVAGPRIDPAIFPRANGLEVRGYVHDLYRHLFACDLAVVQGGLTTSMELTASQRPFLYFPLRNHFEQNFHVRHRLDRHGAGRCMDFERSTPEVIADAIVREIGRPVAYREIDPACALRAARRIAEVLT